VLALALALTLAPPEMHRGVVVAYSASQWLAIDTGKTTAYFSITGADIVSRLDPSIRLPDSCLRRGVVVWFAPFGQPITRIEVGDVRPFAMEIAVEEWVAECRGARAWNVLDASDLAAVERLGAPCWQIREAATKTIRERGPGAFRSLIWARRSGDPEVRMRAGVILDELGWRLSSCP
jgi:hypothetical protein